MIIANQIINKNLNLFESVNHLKEKFWDLNKITREDKPLLNLFKKINGYSKDMFFDKNDFKTFLRPHELDGKFIDFFFYINGQTNEFLTFMDFQNYLLKFLKKNQTNLEMNNTDSLENILRNLFISEENFFKEVEVLKKNLLSNFKSSPELFNFLKILFQDLSNKSYRTDKNILNFSKFNLKLRINHNFSVLSLNDTSSFQVYYQITNDEGVTFDEFLAIFCDYQTIMYFYRLEFENRIREIKNQKFLPLNAIPQNQKFDSEKFIIDKDIYIQEPSKKNLLKNMIINNINVNNETDLVYIEKIEGKRLDQKKPAIFPDKFKLKNNFLEENKETKINFEQPKTDIVFKPQLEDFSMNDIELIEKNEKIKNNDNSIISIQEELSGLILENVEDFKY